MSCGETADVSDKFTFPSDLFEPQAESDVPCWTCVRSRPRWEKKLADFLRSRSIPHYLPTTVKYTFSGRKLRRTAHCLFPGYVFVKGSHDKQSFKESGCVVYVLKPTSLVQAESLNGQIRAVRRLLLEEISAELCTDYRNGERVTIVSGALRGLSGIVIETDNARRLVVWVDMLGVGVSVVLGSKADLMKASAVAPKLVEVE